MPANTLAIAQGLVSILQSIPSSLLTTCPTVIAASPSPQVIRPLSMAGIVAGTQYLVDVSNGEIITPTQADNFTFTAVFSKTHLANWTIGSVTPLYKPGSVILGSVQDPTDLAPCVSITMVQRQTERFDAGWKINSRPTFLLETLANLTNAAAAETFIMQAADTLMAVFVARASIPGANQVYMVYGGLKNTTIPPEQLMYKLLPSGKVYRVHQMRVEAIDQFNVQLQ